MVGTVGAVMALLLSVLYLQVVMLQRQRELDDLVTVQFVNDLGFCWESVFSPDDVRTNRIDLYRANN